MHASRTYESPTFGSPTYGSPIYGSPIYGSHTTGEEQSETTHEIKVYKRRWYILAVFSLLAAIQGHIWCTWNPIVRPLEVAYNWTNADIALLGNWGAITSIFLTPFYSWLITVWGLRRTLLINAGLVVAGSVIRLVPVRPEMFIMIAHLGSFLNCMATFGYSGFVVLSALWFPPNQRTTATAIGAAMNSLGVASAFIIAPRMVPDLCENSTETHNLNDYLTTPEATASPGNNTVIVEKTRQNLMNLLYLHAGLACGIFLLILIYFPARPKIPPSESAAVVRESYFNGMKSVVRKPRFWLVVIPWALVVGVYGDWSALIDVNLKTTGISQSSAGYIGFVCKIASCLGMFVIARLNDVFPRRIKAYLITTHLLFAIFMIWFSLMSEKIVSPSLVQFYISATLASFLVGGSIPLYFELCCETTYPASEPVSMSAQIIPLNLIDLLFNLVFLLPNIGTSWMNWVQAAVCIPSVVLLCCFKENYARLRIDTQTNRPIVNSVDMERSTLLN